MQMVLAQWEEQVQKEDISLSTCLLLLKFNYVTESPTKNQQYIFQIFSELYVLCPHFYGSLDHRCSINLKTAFVGWQERNKPYNRYCPVLQMLTFYKVSKSREMRYLELDYPQLFYLIRSMQGHQKCIHHWGGSRQK